MLLSSRKIQVADNRHWQYDDGEIRQDVDSSVGEPHGELIDAFGTGLFGPEGAYRNAGEDTAELCPDGIGDDGPKDGPERDVEPFCTSGEHTTILEEYRGLCEAKREVIHDETRPEGLSLSALSNHSRKVEATHLQGAAQFNRPKGLNMFSHAILCLCDTSVFVAMV